MTARNFLMIMTISLLGGTLISGCSNGESWHRNEGMIWNTVWHATYKGSESDISATIDSLKEVEKSLSVFDNNSLVSYINSHSCGPVDYHLTKVYEMSRRVNTLSGGLFDPTVAPLVEVWGFGKNRTPEADSIQIMSILPLVGINKTWIDRGMLYKDRLNTSFNFSAIAKGYGVDAAARALEVKGCQDLMVEIGGEVFCKGVNPDGRKWRILIETPDEDYLREVFKTNEIPDFGKELIVELSNEGLATSGNYRNFHSESGKTFGHMISPMTGYPVRTDVVSASVIAPSCMEADALATACMAMGSSAGMEMLDSLGLGGAFILYSGEIRINDVMRDHIVISDKRLEVRDRTQKTTK